MSTDELTRRLYVPNQGYWTQRFSKKYYSDRPLDVKTVENGIIMPPPDKNDQLGGGVFEPDLKFAAGCDNLYKDKRDDSFVLENFDRSLIEKSEEEVVFGGGLTCHFGHFISECLSRMWYLIENPRDRRRYAFLNLYNWRIRTWVYNLFDMLGLPDSRIIIVDKPTQFKSVTVPDQAAYIKEDFTSKFMMPYRRLAARIMPRDDVKKLFLTRSRDLKTKNHISNQEYFEEFYRARGFKVIAPEKLSLGEQFALITGADEIATFLGTLSHWSLFCRPKVKFTMLTRYDEFRSRQVMINQANPIDWYIVSTARNVMYAEQGAGVNLIGPTEYWQRFVRDYFGEEIGIDDRLPPTVVDDYFSHWIKYFSLPQHTQQRIDSVKALYNRMSLLEKQVESARPLLCYETHVAKKGWLSPSLEGEINGVPDDKLSVQALKVYFLKTCCDVFCSVYYPKTGWTTAREGRTMSGSTGRDKPIYGLKIWLERNDRFDVMYRVHDFNGNWSDWKSNGEALISKTALNAIEIKSEVR